MKKVIKYWLLILLSGSIMQIDAQQTLNHQFGFDKDQFSLFETAGGYFRIKPTNHDFYFKDEPGIPALPFQSVKILVPAGAELVNFHYNFEKELFGRNIILDNDKIVYPVSVPLNISKQVTSASFKDAQYPEKLVEYYSTQIMKGFTIFCFTISPFIYESDQNMLFLIKNIELDLEYSVDNQRSGYVRQHDDVVSTLRQQIVNPEALASFYPEHRNAIQKSEYDELDYLIVTTSELKDSFKPLIDWKFRKGLKAEIITLDEIYSSYKEPTDQLKIKRCLQENYQNRNLKWVLLGGDHDIVPIQRCYGVVNEDIDDNTIPTDLFYACFDKNFDWNATIDDRIGEPHIDYVDILPEIYVSRIPVRNKTQVQTFVKKTLRYELDPPRKDFAEKMLLSGVKSWNIWNERSDNHHRTEFMYHKYVRPSWYGEKFDFYDTGSSFLDDDQYDVSVHNLMQQLNEGYGIFHFAGHGNSNSLLMETGTIFSTRESLKLRHTGSGIMLTTTCEVNAFDEPNQCLSESFLFNPDGGCTALFGSSRLGLGRPDTLTNLGPSYRYNGIFFKYLFDKDSGPGSNSFAAIATAAKTSFSGIGTGGYWYLQYALNAMGDPEFSIYTRDPEEFDNVKIFRWGNNVRVNTGGVRDCRISLTSANMEEGFQETVDGVEYHTFSKVPERFHLTITKPNYIPYWYRSRIATGFEVKTENFVQVYPNPVVENLNLELYFQNANFVLHDLNGRIILEGFLDYGTNIIPVNDISSGVYILQVIHRSETQSTKIFIK